MKKAIYRIMVFFCCISLFAGLFTAYAKMDANKDTMRGGGYENPIYFSFWVSMQSGGNVDLATPREKIVTGNAQYNLTTVGNTTGYKFYMNVRSQSGGYVVGNAHDISYGASAPLSFGVSYQNGYGNVGTKYRPSGMSSSSSTSGVILVEGEWLP